MADRGNFFLRNVDFWIGIPLVRLAGFFKCRRRRRPDRSEIHSIGVLATAAIGDTILLSAVLRDIKDAHPGAFMTFFAGGSNAGITGMICPQDKLIRLPVSNPLKSARIIRSAGVFDLWIDFGPWPRVNALLSVASRSRYSIGFRTPGQARHFAYDSVADHRSDRHEIDNLRALAAEAGVDSTGIPAIAPSWSDSDHDKTIAVHMIPGGYLSHYKEWSPDRWVRLLDGLTAGGNRGRPHRGAGRSSENSKASASSANIRNPSMTGRERSP